MAAYTVTLAAAAFRRLSLIVFWSAVIAVVAGLAVALLLVNPAYSLEYFIKDADQTVTLTGWVARRRDHGGVIFIDLRDRSGLAQVVFRESEVAEAAHDLRSEYCLKVTGIVEARPEGSENPNLASGAIEVNVSDLEILNESTALPFQSKDTSGGEVGEETRLKYRYLDLRRSYEQKALRLRAKVGPIPSSPSLTC